MAQTNDEANLDQDEGSIFSEPPFERAFPPGGAAELTESYIPALEREMERVRRRKGQRKA